MATDGTYAVEIRYASPDESAGSTYTVAVGSGEGLVGTVCNTGAWSSSSPWLPLRRIELSPGPHHLCRYALATWPVSRS